MSIQRREGQLWSKYLRTCTYIYSNNRLGFGTLTSATPLQTQLQPQAASQAASQPAKGSHTYLPRRKEERETKTEQRKTQKNKNQETKEPRTPKHEAPNLKFLIPNTISTHMRQAHIPVKGYLTHHHHHRGSRGVGTRSGSLNSGNSKQREWIMQGMGVGASNLVDLAAG